MGRRIKRRKWDEQLSGQPVDWEGAQITEASRRRLATRQAKRPGFGLWWKVFEDDGRLAIIPKGDIVFTLFVVGVLYAMLRIMGVQSFGHLVAPMSLILLTLGTGYVLGSIGTVASGPALMYGCLAIGWTVWIHDTSFKEGPTEIITIVQVVGILLVLSAFTPGLRRDIGGTVALAFYGVGAAWFVARRLAVGVIDEATASTYLGYAYMVSLAFALLFVGINIYKQYKLMSRWEQGAEDEKKSVVLVAAGIVPLALASILSGAGCAVALTVATVCYVALAVAGRLRSPKGLCCPILLLLICAALGIWGRADTSMLPPGLLTEWITAIAEQPVVGFFVTGAMQIADGFVLLMGQTAASLAVPVFGLEQDAAAQIPAEFVCLLCLLPGVFAMASVMGVGVSVLELVRPQLVEDQLARERAAKPIEEPDAEGADAVSFEEPEAADADTEATDGSDPEAAGV